MLVRPRKAEKEEIKQEPKPIKTSKKQCLCSKCHKMQPYNEITVQINYGINSKQKILIDGIERVCAVCGWHVDDIATTEMNKTIAENKLKNI